MTLSETYAQNYWQLANLITGFAVAEVLATLFAVGSNADFRKGVHDWRCIVVLFTAIAHFFYVGAVYFWYRQELKLPPADECDIRKGTAVVFGARATASILFGTLLIFVTLVIP